MTKTCKREVNGRKRNLWAYLISVRIGTHEENQTMFLFWDCIHGLYINLNYVTLNSTNLVHSRILFTYLVRRVSVRFTHQHKGLHSSCP